MHRTTHISYFISCVKDRAEDLGHYSPTPDSRESNKIFLHKIKKYTN